jgi:hypothetical protein
MQRLIEQPTGDGEVREDARVLGRVHYHLSVYQHFSPVEGQPVPGSVEVEGRLTALDALDFADLQGRRVELTLYLNDGRALEFLVSDADGAIHSTGRSLYDVPI